MGFLEKRKERGLLERNSSRWEDNFNTFVYIRVGGNEIEWFVSGWR
jgi:hypothetical protein